MLNSVTDVHNIFGFERLAWIVNFAQTVGCRNEPGWSAQEVRCTYGPCVRCTDLPSVVLGSGVPVVLLSLGEWPTEQRHHFWVVTRGQDPGNRVSNTSQMFHAEALDATASCITWHPLETWVSHLALRCPHFSPGSG